MFFSQHKDSLYTIFKRETREISQSLFQLDVQKNKIKIEIDTHGKQRPHFLFYWQRLAAV